MNSQPFWMDEAFSYYVARNSAHTIIFGGVDNHPPLFYLIQHGWQALFPDQDLMRVPAIAAGVLTVAVVGLMGADLFGRTAGLAAALVVALSANHIYLSLDTRMYTLMALGAALATWGALGLVDRRCVGYHGLYVFGASVAIYSQFIALVYLLSLNLALAGVAFTRGDKIRRLVGLLLANLLLLLLVSPAFLLATSSAGSFPGLGATGLSEIPWFIKNTLGFPGIDGPVGLGLFLFAGCFFLFGSYTLLIRNKSHAFVLFFSVSFYILFVILVDQLFVPIMANRILILVVVPCALLFGVGFAALRPGWLKIAAISSMLVVGGYSASMVRRHAPKVEDVPGALAYAKRAGFDGLPIATCDIFTSSTASLYSGDRPVVWLAAKGPAIKFTPEIIGGVPINDIRNTPREIVLRRLEDANIAQSGDRLLAGSDRVVGLESVCNIDSRLRRAGFTLVEKQAMQNGPAMMESIWTKVSLWQRDSSAAGRHPQ